LIIPGAIAIRFATATRALAMICDTLVLIATWMKTLGIWRAARQVGIKTSLTTLIIRDGTVYFGILIIFNTADVIIAHVQPSEDASSVLTYYIGVLSTIMLSRLMLNLRNVSVALPNNSEFEDGRNRISSIKFDYIGSVLGNIGAPVSYDDDLFEASEVEGEIKETLSDPLAAGLFDEKPLV